MTPIVINGCNGKMAAALTVLVQEEAAFDYLGSFSCKTTPSRTGNTNILPSDVLGITPTIIDFSHRECTKKLLSLALKTPCKLVIGTSGLNDNDEELLIEVSKRRAVFRATNFSRGVHTILKSLALIGKELGDTWQAQVLDFHFADKLDTPSATAKKIAHTLSSNGSPACEISTLRLGDGVSEHTAIIAGTGERIEIAHKLLDRKAFSSTIVDAINFLKGQDVGLYGMEDLYN
jgi:4-hydroxy-tetrahydrodipicolinate reductase